MVPRRFFSFVMNQDTPIYSPKRWILWKPIFLKDNLFILFLGEGCSPVLEGIGNRRYRNENIIGDTDRKQFFRPTLAASDANSAVSA